jgi:tetratricopeptide (TPR) repeat protein
LVRETNRLDDAEQYYRRALAIHESAYGPNHPLVASNLNNLALLLRATNRLGEAEPLYLRALAIREKSYGCEHPEVANSLNNLALFLQATNRLDQAERIFHRSAAILVEFGRRTGHLHPYMNLAFNNYAGLLEAMGRSQSDIEAVFSKLMQPLDGTNIRFSVMTKKT